MGVIAQIFRYVVAGGAASVVHLLVYAGTYKLLSLPAYAASTIGFAGAILCNFLIQYFYVFEVEARDKRSIIKYFLKYSAYTIVISYSANIIILETLIYLGINWFVSQVAAILLVFAINYCSSKMLIFR